MTTKEIAGATGKDERTVQRWIRKAGDKMSSISDKMSLACPHSPADFDFEEAVYIIEIGMGKSAAGIYRASAQQRPEVKGTLSEHDIAMISQIVAMTVSQTIKALDGRISAIEEKVEERKALLPPPSISPRSNINRIVREYAHREDIEYATAWRRLYSSFTYRTHTDIVRCAKNRGMDTLEYAELEGHIDMLEAVAVDTMQKERKWTR